MPLSQDDMNEILRRHGIAPPPGDEAAGQGASTAAGVELSVGGHKDDEGRKILTLSIGTVSQSRSCPIADDEAHDMVARLQERRAIPSRHALGSALEHLILRCSKMYAETEIYSFSLKPVYLQEGGYRVGSVRMFATRRLQLRPRRDGAHEGKLHLPRNDAR